jgi:hypothetical protein
MSDKTSAKLTTVRLAPPPVAPSTSAPQLPQRPAPAPQVRSVFDCAPANVATARGKADAARRAFQQAIAATRAALRHHEEAMKAVETDADFAAFFAHEGLSKDTLKKFGDLAQPFVSAFTVS